MQPDELERIAAQHVPGAGSPAIIRLRAGLVNDTYRVVRDGRTYALRVAGSNGHALGVDRPWEARVLERTVPALLAPAVACSDPQRGILVQHWVEGRQWHPGEVGQSANVARIAELLRRIHALGVPSPARLMGPAQWIERYAAGAPAAASVLRAGAASRIAALGSLPSARVICHSDLHLLNLIDRGDSLMLLDWEYAHAADPLWDLAGWSANNDLCVDAAEQLLTAYLGRTPRPDECSRLRLLSWLYDYVCWLWSGLYLSLRGAGETADGVAERARRLGERLAATASGRAE
jgi:thiamine kinase-like enzyme